MWRMVVVPVLLGILSMTRASPGPAQAEVAARLRALENTWLRAATARDTSTLDGLLASDFTHIDYRGRMLSRVDALRSTSAPPGVHQTLSDERVRIYGSTGIVTGVNTITGPDGREALRLRFTDVFVRVSSRWKAVSAQETAASPNR